MLQVNHTNAKPRPATPQSDRADRTKPSPISDRADMINEGRIEIDPDLAQFVLDEHAYDGQRSVNDFQINYLAAIMEADDWHPGSQIAFAQLPDGTRLMVNGYHRLHALIKSGLPQ